MSISRFRELLIHVLLGLALAFAIAEAAWRLFSSPPLLVVDPVFDFALRPSARLRWDKYDVRQEVVTNAFGFHDEEYPLKKPAGTKRVVVVGNSFMEAMQVDVGATFPKQLQRRLGPGVQAINASRMDRGCLDYEMVVHQVVWDFEPDLVLVAFTMTDPWHDSVNSPRIARDAAGRPVKYLPSGINARLPWLKPLLHRSWAIKHALASISVLTTKLKTGVWTPPVAAAPAARAIAYDSTMTLDDDTEAGRAQWAISLGALERIAAACRERKTPLLVMIVPGEDQVDPLPGAAPVKAYAQRKVLAFGAAQKVPVLDLTPAFLGSPEKGLYYMEGHWRPRGHVLAAEQAAAFIARERLLR